METKKVWGGRFEKELDDDAKTLSYTLESDRALAIYDLQVNKAHVKALHKAGHLNSDDVAKLTTCLDELIKEGRDNADTLFSGEDEDIHSCVERLVTERCGDAGKKMHTGKSRNDQVITDTRLYVKDALSSLIHETQMLISVLHEKAEAYKQVLFPGFTHFQPAQPVLLAHHLLAYVEKFFRDINRFQQAFDTADVCSLGSGAMAGNNYALDRAFVAQELGFSRYSNNSMDAVSDRDFILETLSACSICMTHLSRFCEEIIVFTSPVIGMMSVGDDFTTGSSLMPQKKNPDVAELIRGKTGRVHAAFYGLQTAIKGLPLTYNRDLQEDKVFLFDAVETVNLSLRCFRKMMATLDIHEDAIQAALKKGYGVATDFADYLVAKNVPFRDAHELTGKVVLYAIENNKQLHELTLKEFQSFCGNIEEDVFGAITFEAAVAAKDIYGGTAFNQVEKQLNDVKGRMKWNKH